MSTMTRGKDQPENLRELIVWWLIVALFATAGLLLPSSRASAQAAPAGPLPATAPSDRPAAQSQPSARLEIGGKPNLSGNWVMNKDESDDPRQAMQEAMGSPGGGGGNRGNGGGGGGPRVGMGGGGAGGGGGVGRGGGWGGRGQGSGQGSGQGGGGGRRGGQNSGNLTNDLSQLIIEQTASSAKVTGDSGRVLAVYSATDSSPAKPSASSASSPTSSSSNSTSNASGGPSSGGSSSNAGSTSGSRDSSGDNESASAPPAAQWQGAQLVSVTQGRREGVSTTRTYELSPDGKQLYVTTKIENPRFKNPVTYRLVYDPAPSGG
jgi:hypothetical protein